MADARLLFPPGWQLTDSNDDPVSGGVVKIFDSGTSNPRTVYSDSGLTTAIGTEFSTNSVGRPSSGGSEVLVYASEGNVKLQALTSASTSIWTFDDVVSALDTSGFSLSNALLDQPVLTKTASYTIVDADRGSLINFNSGDANVVGTLPSAADVGDGWTIGVKNIHATATDVSVTAVGGQTIDGATTKLIDKQYGILQLVSDAANWHTYAASLFQKVKLTAYTSDDTHTVTTGTAFALVFATGAGGGGGGADNGDTSAVAAGGGGEGGGTCIKLWNAAELGATAAITIGTAGTAGANTGGNGGDGGDSTVNPAGTGSTLTASGGDGGDGSLTSTTDAGVGGTGESGGTNGDINLAGGGGESGGISTIWTVGGTGGGSFWGGGGAGGHVDAAGSSTVGIAGPVYGSGGGGAGCVNTTTGAAGGAGGAGFVAVLEFVL